MSRPTPTTPPRPTLEESISDFTRSFVDTNKSAATISVYRTGRGATGRMS